MRLSVWAWLATAAIPQDPVNKHKTPHFRKFSENGVFPYAFLQVTDVVQHFADFGHTLNKILFHSHGYIPPKTSVVLTVGLRMVRSALVLVKVFAGITRR